MFAASCIPQRRSRAAWLWSAAVHLAGASLLLQFGGAILAPPAHRSAATLVFIPPPAPVKPAPPAPALKAPKLRRFKLPDLPPARPVEMARRPMLIEAPVVQASPAPPAARPAAAIQTPEPPPRIRTGVLEPGRQAAVPQVAPATAVQLGAFSRPLQNEPNLPVPAVTRTAGFDSAPAGKPANEVKRTASTGGFDAALTTSRVPGASRTTMVSAAGFGSAAAASAGPARNQPQAALAGFGDAVLGKAEAPARAARPQASDSTPVEITFKPRPAYTDQARRARVEGEILLEAVFTAAGEVRVVRIIRGLPHGLNETALAAAQAMRFRPALRHGQPVDTTATVRMNFELAD